MGTKNDPGKFDCYANADPDEPMFVLLGRDPAACLAVTFWVKLRMEMGQDLHDPQIWEARDCARSMEVWARELGKGDKVDEAGAASRRLVVHQEEKEVVDG